MSQFDTFYAAVHGHAPFPWQRRLAEIEQLPELIDIPTGCGKTSVIDALAWREQQCGRIPRIVYVVDRRLVVDDVHAHAKRLEGKGGVGGQPWRVEKWRGGMTIDEDWLLEPERPTVVVSTVDQVGSRLLFRGYGLSWKERSVHAGLLSRDTLFVLDEVHLSRPFARTLRRVAERIAGEPDHGFGLPPRVVEMSATPGNAESRVSAFRLDSDDQAHPLLERRLATHKRARLVQVAKGWEFSRKVAEEARQAPGRIVGVVVNRVADARKVFLQLRESAPSSLLLIGPTRPTVRDRVLAATLPRLRPTLDRPSDGERTYVVATQTVEVGADLDFDALVTEAAPLDSLRQRFGRLDRIGNHGTTEATIVLRPDSRRKDPIYGDDIGEAWKWLKKAAERQVVDLGLAAEPALHMPAPSEEVGLPEGPPPELPLPTEILAETHPWLVEDLNPEPLLHGERDPRPSVWIVWRWELSERNREHWGELVGRLPPVRGEMLRLSRREALHWLGFGSQNPRPALVWRAGEPAALLDPAPRTDLREGEKRNLERLAPAHLRQEEILVVPESYGGADSFGWSGAPAGPVQAAPPPAIEDGAMPTRLDVRKLAYADLRRADGGRSGLAFARVELAEVLEPKDGDWVFPEAWEPHPRRSADPSRLVIRAREGKKPDDGGTVPASGAPLALEAHTRDVLAELEALLRARDLPAELHSHLLRAAAAHDAGKKDRNFQAMLHGGDVFATVRALGAGHYLAKGSVPYWNGPARQRARRASRLPRGWRHEVESLGRAELDSAPEAVRHLVATHHGRGRPWLPDQGESPVLFANAFWRLVEGYGLWGLAHAEALIRIADRRASKSPGRGEASTPAALAAPPEPKTSRRPEAMTLLAFEGQRFLGFLGALGVLRMAEAAVPGVALSWDGERRARLHGIEAEALVDAVRHFLDRNEFDTDRTLDAEGRRLPWDLCGGGRAQLRNTLPPIREQLRADAETLERVLFGPWAWADKGDSLGWLPSMRDHALLARAPTNDPAVRESGALWMAWEGIGTVGRTPGGRALGWRRRRGRKRPGPWTFVWPLWSDPATLPTVRSLLRLDSRAPFRAGITERWSTRRVRTAGKSSVLTEPRLHPQPPIEPRANP